MRCTPYSSAAELRTAALTLWNSPGFEGRSSNLKHCSLARSIQLRASGGDSSGPGALAGFFLCTFGLLLSRSDWSGPRRPAFWAPCPASSCRRGDRVAVRALHVSVVGRGGSLCHVGAAIPPAGSSIPYSGSRRIGRGLYPPTRNSRSSHSSADNTLPRKVRGPTRWRRTSPPSASQLPQSRRR